MNREQLIACLSDPWWRLCNLYAITDKKGKLVKFKPNLAQSLLYQRLHWMNYNLKSRQHGISTFFGIFILDRMLFEKNKAAGIVDFTIEDAKGKLAKIKLAWDHLDDADIHPDTWMLGQMIKQGLQLTTDSKEALEWSNGCKVRCGTSLRGSTIQYLHISELGKIALKYPVKAREIIEGANNAIHEGGIMIIETTHEGGKVGEAYRHCKRAMDHIGKKLTRLDLKFHFFAWWQDVENVLPAEDVEIPAKMHGYFETLLQHPLGPPSLSPEQKAWYVKKAEEQGYAMLKEHPSVPEEAFQAIVTGAIYGELIMGLRAQGRVCDFPTEKGRPMFTFWDIGYSDTTVIWFVQFVGLDIRVVDHWEETGESAGGAANAVRRYEARHDCVVARHYLPHDANTKSAGSGLSYVDHLRTAGFSNITVVSRTPDIWAGINALRELLPRMFFHKTNCDTPRERLGRELPSGLSCLESYHTDTTDDGKAIRENPVHDASSHSADALRTFAEAFHRGMIDFEGVISQRQARGLKPKVHTGFGTIPGPPSDGWSDPFDPEPRVRAIR